MSGAGQRSGRARRYVAGRDRQVKWRCTPEEHAVLIEAASSAGLTPSGYAAEAALAAARGVRAPSLLPVREALLELLAARTQLRRYAVNVNQGVKVLNAGGVAPPWLAGAVSGTDRAVVRLDAAIDEVAHALRRAARTTGGSARGGRARQLLTGEDET